MTVSVKKIESKRIFGPRTITQSGFVIIFESIKYPALKFILVRGKTGSFFSLKRLNLILKNYQEYRKQQLIGIFSRI